MHACHQCGNTFSNRWNLSRHVSRLHSNRSVWKQTQHPVDTTQEKSAELWKGGTNHQHESADEYCSEDQTQSDEGSEDDDREPLDMTMRKRRRIDDDLEEEEEANSDDSSLKNSSDEDSDNCASSSKDTSEDDDSDVDMNDIYNGEHREGNDYVGGEQSSAQPFFKYNNFARYRNSDNGLYAGWKTQHRKPHVVRHREWLMKLSKTFGSDQKQLIKGASNSQLDAVREIAANVCSGRAVMHYRPYGYMMKNKETIRTFGDETSSYDELRRTLLDNRKCVLRILLLHATPHCIKSSNVVYRRDEFK